MAASDARNKGKYIEISGGLLLHGTAGFASLP
jgi:hypothetical protein